MIMVEPHPEDLRADFDSLVPLARQLYAEGKTVGDVMRAVYGADLPAEAYAFWRAFFGGKAKVKPTLEYMHHPWELISVASPIHQSDPVPWQREQEERAFSQVPRFLPLMWLVEDDA